MENKEINEANVNILQTTPVDVDKDDHAQESNNEDAPIGDKPIDICGNDLVGQELRETTNQIFNENQIDSGKNLRVTI
jgi:hypothetical protein